MGPYREGDLKGHKGYENSKRAISHVSRGQNSLNKAEQPLNKDPL